MDDWASAGLAAETCPTSSPEMRPAFRASLGTRKLTSAETDHKRQQTIGLKPMPSFDTILTVWDISFQVQIACPLSVARQQKNHLDGCPLSYRSVRLTFRKRTELFLRTAGGTYPISWALPKLGAGNFLFWQGRLPRHAISLLALSWRRVKSHQTPRTCPSWNITYRFSLSLPQFGEGVSSQCSSL